MNKKTLKQELESGMPLDLILELTTGQCGCTIHKVLRADDIVQYLDFDSVCYIPDMELNDIPYEKPQLSAKEIEDVLQECYTFQDFIDLCHGDVNKAKIVYENCDWQHPSAEYEEMKQIGWGPDYERPQHGDVSWDSDDLIKLAKSAGVEMTDEQAEDWWREHEAQFRKTMLQYGNQLLASML